MENYLIFLNQLYQFNPSIIEAVQSGYLIFMESISDVLKIAISGYKDIIANVANAKLNENESHQPYYSIECKMGVIPFKVIITKAFGEVKFRANIEYTVTIGSWYLFSRLQNSRFGDVNEYLSGSDVCATICHELGHLIEYSAIENKYGGDAVLTHVRNSISRASKTDGKSELKQTTAYHSDLAERMPNRVGTVAGSIHNANIKGKREPNDIMSHLTKHADDITGKVITNNTVKESRKIMQKSANAIHELSKDSGGIDVF